MLSLEILTFWQSFKGRLADITQYFLNIPTVTDTVTLVESLLDLIVLFHCLVNYGSLTFVEVWEKLHVTVLLSRCFFWQL